MLLQQFPEAEQKQAAILLAGKSDYSLQLLETFFQEFRNCGPVAIHAAKTMMGIADGNRRIAWVIQLGKSFVDVLFPFSRAYPDNLCFRKIAQVPGSSPQYNHHLRICFPEDINEEVLKFMKLSLKNSN